MVNCSNSIIKMSLRFVLGRENVPCVAEVVNRSLKADCTDFTSGGYHEYIGGCSVHRRDIMIHVGEQLESVQLKTDDRAKILMP